MDESAAGQKRHRFGLGMIMELFDVSPKVAVVALASSSLIVVATIFYFFHSAPPTNITISSGPEGSVFQKNAIKYAKILERNGVKLKVLTSNGSLENLERLAKKGSHVDVGFAQAGMSDAPTENLISLASISYQPLLVFYRGAPIDLLSALQGKRIAIGAVGSGTRGFALSLLGLNGIKEGGSTPLLDLDADDAYKGIKEGKIDAAFVMSESASSEILHTLLNSPDIHLFNFKQANAYSRKIDYLNVMDFPEGSIDFALDIPAHDVALLGPMVELVATKDLHPAISDLLLEAAVEIHGKPGVFQRRGDFPAPIEHAIRISDDSNRFFKSGKTFLYRYLPFWLASLTSRIIAIFIPMLVILVPALKSIPSFFKWRMQRKIHRRYSELLAVEKEIRQDKDGHLRDELRKKFDHIERSVNAMKIPPSFADQFYGLRGHIAYVRGLVVNR
jgi:hypothetical protein